MNRTRATNLVRQAFWLWTAFAWLITPAGLALDLEKIETRVDRLVLKLNADRATERDAAEAELLELGQSRPVEEFLELLPEESDQMPVAVRERLSKIRRQVEESAARRTIEPTRVSLDAEQWSLARVLNEIREQTGNAFAMPEEEDKIQPLTVKFREELYWPAVDQILDQSQLDVYPYANGNVLSLVWRHGNRKDRHASADYSGPFRIEATEIRGERSLRDPDRTSLGITMEFAWEPRLEPIAISQPGADFEATLDTGAKLRSANPEATYDVEIASGTHATQLVLPFELPSREARYVAALTGKLRVLVPGRRAKFRFDDLASAAGRSLERGGVHVSIDDVRSADGIWEIRMRLRFEEHNDALQSHRGWVFENRSYLVGEEGEPIENVGFETTRQTENEVGIAYLFDLPQGLAGMAWVYETPVAILDVPVEYELTDIKLP